MMKVSDLFESPKYYSQIREGTWLYSDRYGLCRIAQVEAGVLALISISGAGCNRHSSPLKPEQPLKGLTINEIREIGAMEMNVLQTADEVKVAFDQSFVWPPHNHYGND